jgi:hypothetical protein
MRFIVALLACAGFGGLSTVLADPPASSTSTAPAATSAPTASSATAPASTAAPASSNASADADAIVTRRMKAAGYHEEMHNGTKKWCKDEIDVGSRLSSGRKTCATAAQIDDIARQTQDELRQQLNLQTNPSGR